MMYYIHLRKKLIFTLLMLTAIKADAQFSKGAIDPAVAEIQELTWNGIKAIVNRDSVTMDKILASDYSLNGIGPALFG